MSQLTLFTDSRFPCPQRLQLVIFELGLKITNIHQLDIIKREQQVCGIDITYEAKRR